MQFISIVFDDNGIPSCWDKKYSFIKMVVIIVNFTRTQRKNPENANLKLSNSLGNVIEAVNRVASIHDSFFVPINIMHKEICYKKKKMEMCYRLDANH